MLAIAFCLCGCGGITDEAIDSLRQNGYEAERIDEYIFCISEGSAKYYFSKGVFRPVLRTVVYIIPKENEDIFDRDLQLIVEITKGRRNRMSIRFTDAYVRKKATGEQYVDNRVEYFTFKKDFSPENLTNNRGFHDVRGDYEYYLNKYTTSDELLMIYNRGLEIEKDL